MWRNTVNWLPKYCCWLPHALQMILRHACTHRVASISWFDDMQSLNRTPSSVIEHWGARHQIARSSRTIIKCAPVLNLQSFSASTESEYITMLSTTRQTAAHEGTTVHQHNKKLHFATLHPRGPRSHLPNAFHCCVASLLPCSWGPQETSYAWTYDSTGAAWDSCWRTFK